MIRSVGFPTISNTLVLIISLTKDEDRSSIDLFRFRVFSSDGVPLEFSTTTSAEALLVLGSVESVPEMVLLVLGSVELVPETVLLVCSAVTAKKIELVFLYYRILLFRTE